MTPLSPAQRGVAAGMAAGLACTLLAWIVPPFVWPWGTGADTLAGRIAFWAPWEIPPIATLTLGIAFIAHHRFFHPGSIDGANPGDDRVLAVARSYLQNTLEQLVLALAVRFCLAVLLPQPWLAVLPTTAVLFAIGRASFAVGYGKGAASRAFGFAITFYPSVIGLAVAAGLALVR